MIETLAARAAAPSATLGAGPDDQLPEFNPGENRPPLTPRLPGNGLTRLGMPGLNVGAPDCGFSGLPGIIPTVEFPIGEPGITWPSGGSAGTGAFAAVVAAVWPAARTGVPDPPVHGIPIYAMIGAFWPPDAGFVRDAAGVVDPDPPASSAPEPTWIAQPTPSAPSPTAPRPTAGLPVKFPGMKLEIPRFPVT